MRVRFGRFVALGIAAAALIIVLFPVVWVALACAVTGTCP